jgi:uncharacterized RDD family membrane protein YckC
LACSHAQSDEWNGQSIGKRLLGIRVVRMDGSPVSLARIVFLRNLVPELIGAGCSLFGLVDACFIFADNQRCLHASVGSWPAWFLSA